MAFDACTLLALASINTISGLSVNPKSVKILCVFSSSASVKYKTTLIARFVWFTYYVVLHYKMLNAVCESKMRFDAEQQNEENGVVAGA